MAFIPYDPEKAALLNRRKVLALSFVALIALLAGQAWLLRSWAAGDTRPPAWDQSIHLQTAYEYKIEIAKGNLDAVLHPVPKPGMPAFPPLYHLALQHAVSQPNPEQAAYWVNFAYFILLTLCLFGIVFDFRSDWAAFAASAAFVLSPGVQDLLFNQLVDLPVLALSAAAYWAFLRSEEFRYWPGSIAFGVLFAAGMLHKWSFFSYMIPAYWVWLRAMNRPDEKAPGVAAFFIALFLSAPWYLMNWPLLMPRLFQASADFAVPVWKGLVFFQYLTESVEGLGPALWIMGWIGLLVPKYRRHDHRGWLIPFWILSAYVFWAIVPNRQMRFLLPGLPGLAVLACGSWPGAMIGGMLALQLFGALNFARGWMGPLRFPTPLGGITLLPNHPPAKEDWAVDSILKEAEVRRDPDGPSANLTMIANAPHFNGTTFTWRRTFLGLQGVRLRGVNKRLCEFSQFVVVKTGSLGPATVIGGLKEASNVVLAKNSWFRRSYDEVRKWQLPDGSEAILFERAAPKTPPFKEKAPLTFEVYDQGNVTAEKLVVELGAFDAARGVYPRAKMSARKLIVRGLELRDVALELEDLLMVSGSAEGAHPWDEVRFLKLKRLRILSARVSADALQSFGEQRLRGLRLSEVKLDGTVKASGKFKEIPVGLELSPELDAERKRLRLRLVSVKVGPNPIPVGALNRIKELSISLEPNPETPFFIDLPGLTAKGGSLSIP